MVMGTRKSTKLRRRTIRFGMAVLGGWRFWRDSSAYASRAWYASYDGLTIGPVDARWMAVNQALRQMGVK